MIISFQNRLILVTLALVLVASLPHMGARAALPPLEAQPEETGTLAASPLVLRAQKALSKLGFYLGPEDGRLDDATRAAVIIYQRANGLETTGRVTTDLVAKMEYAVGVRKLMRQLEDARADSIKDARSKLLSHPATRDLIRAAPDDITADPTRDATSCLEKPTALCLLNEAVESAKAIPRAELRDWAFGEILIAQARAGLGELAMETAARIADPRLVIVALRDIAEAQAAAGHAEQAMTAADIIPDPEKQADALAAIAEIQVRRGDRDDAKITVRRLLDGVDDIGDTLKRIAYRTRAAVIFARAGDRETAEQELGIAEAGARQLSRNESISAGMRYVASALADMAETSRALEMLQEVSSPSDRMPVLMSAAEAQARAGDAAAALATAEGIDNVRYRAILLGKIALAQAESGRLEDADTTIQMALAAIERIDRPYARSYAVSRIALAMTRLHAWAESTPEVIAGRRAAARKAIEAAQAIDDRRLKAHTLWLIAAHQRAGDDDGWKQTEQSAEQATEEVVGALSRVWMFADLAEGHALAGEEKAAWRAFDHGVAIARTIDNSWSRARTLAKLAATLIRLVDPGLGAVPVDP